MRRSTVPVLALLALSPLAQAQSLRMDVNGRLETSLTGPSSSSLTTVEVSAQIYFSADAPPSGVSGDQTEFPIDYFVLDLVARGMGRVERIQFSGDSGFEGSIRADPNPSFPFPDPIFRFQVTLPAAGALGGDAILTLIIGNPNGYPGPSPSTLPDSVFDYLNSNDIAQLSASVFGSTTAIGANSTWDPDDAAFDRGIFSFRAVAADPPTPAPEACSDADLAEPFEVLDFSDVLAFLTAFGAGCP